MNFLKAVIRFKIKSSGTIFSVKINWRAISPSLKSIYFTPKYSKNFETANLFSIVETMSLVILGMSTSHNYLFDTLCFTTKCCFKANEKGLCLWLPIGHRRNISRATGDIKLKLLGMLLLLLLLLQFK